jgi:hypothetical protein
MAVNVTLTGISAMFSPDEIECLVRTAGNAVCGDRANLTSRQLELAQRVHQVIRDDEGRTDGVRSVPAHRLVALAEELDVDPFHLDDLVHDLSSNSASEINNDGLEAQIPFLLDEVGEVETEQAIRSAAIQAPQ